jgi:CheY-like chemotaxis protein
MEQTAHSIEGGMNSAGPRQTILVVDDEAEILEILRDYLEANGFAVRTAGDGATALALLADGPADCLLLDIMMPGASGFEVCRQIRASSDVPILFLSARDGDSDKIRGLGLGDDYIVTESSKDPLPHLRPGSAPSGDAGAIGAWRRHRPLVRR